MSSRRMPVSEEMRRSRDWLEFAVLAQETWRPDFGRADFALPDATFWTGTLPPSRRHEVVNHESLYLPSTNSTGPQICKKYLFDSTFDLPDNEKVWVYTRARGDVGVAIIRRVKEVELQLVLTGTPTGVIASVVAGDLPEGQGILHQEWLWSEMPSNPASEVGRAPGQCWAIIHHTHFRSLVSAKCRDMGYATSWANKRIYSPHQIEMHGNHVIKAVKRDDWSKWYGYVTTLDEHLAEVHAPEERRPALSRSGSGSDRTKRKRPRSSSSSSRGRRARRHRRTCNLMGMTSSAHDVSSR